MIRPTPISLVSVFACLAALSPLCRAQPQPSPGVYDLVEKAYAPLMSPEDPLGFAMKVRNLSADPYRFWRGAKEPFYAWAKDNPTVQQWLNDAAARIVVHGDLHPGNIGLYASHGKFGRELAFGAVDFDETAKLPFQVELLQGAITFQLLAREKSMKLTDADTRQLIDAILEAYRTTLDSDKTATELLQQDPWVGKLLREAEKDKYKEELEKYVEGDKFVQRVLDKRGKVKEVLRETKGKGTFADAVEEALLHTPDGKDLFADADIKKKSVEHIARRTQLEAAGSEGLNKFLVLLKRKKGPNHLILYLKQQVPASAERSGFIEKDPRPPGQRSSDDMHLLLNPPVYFNSWCNMDGLSYRVTIKEPWTETLEGGDLRTMYDLQQMARIWGVVAGSMHRQQKDKVAAIKERLTPDLTNHLRELSTSYAARARGDFEKFAADRRTREQINKADAELRSLVGGR
jgi:hypothetical protein